MSNVIFATTILQRLCGMLRSRVCSQGETLVLVPCKSIHTFGMREALDIAFVDRGGEVLMACRTVPPSRTLKHKNAALVLERRSRFSKVWYETGQVLNMVPNGRKRNS